EAALVGSGASLKPEWNQRGPFSHEFGFCAMTGLMRGEVVPTAVFCTNDLIAFGALDAVRSLGLSVPRDAWIVGFDDVDMAQWPSFDLTTVHQPSREMAASAVRMLLDRIADPEVPYGHSTFPCRLVVRGSTDHAKA
ncbi:substrate-binding domain-containing protein, partial [Rhodococcus sp. G-MC3]|uniref:substrate-binding domain-containing protein n=1 Tax=Rhodococcus sp. G-MC3 TaxID=3046209 RepID=UPI0024B9936B